MSTVVCGVTLDRAIGQAHVYDITAKSFNRHSVITGPTDVFVRVAGSRKQGSQVTIMPGDAFRVLKTVWAPDHLPVALVLELGGAVPTELVAYQHGRVVGILRTDVAKDDVSHTLNAANEANPQLTPTAVTGAAGAFWMLGSYPCATGTCSALMRSADGGKSFVRVGTPPAGIYGIEFANLLDGYRTAREARMTASIGLVTEARPGDLRLPDSCTCRHRQSKSPMAAPTCSSPRTAHKVCARRYNWRRPR